MLVYLGLGVVWAWWLEYYTTKYLPEELGGDWVWPERFFHIALWPVTLSLFIYNIFNHK